MLAVGADGPTTIPAESLSFGPAPLPYRVFLPATRDARSLEPCGASGCSAPFRAAQLRRAGPDPRAQRHATAVKLLKKEFKEERQVLRNEYRRAGGEPRRAARQEERRRLQLRERDRALKEKRVQVNQLENSMGTGQAAKLPLRPEAAGRPRA